MHKEADTIDKFTEDEKQSIVEEFLPKIKSWTIRMKGTLPDSVEVEDLFSAASVGLIESIERFDKSRNVTFSTYAERRIKGAILDALRNVDFLPRNVRTKLKLLESKINELSKKLGRLPNHNEIVNNTDFSDEEVYNLLTVKNNDKLLSLDETVGNDENNLIDFIKSTNLTPEDEVLKSKLTARLGCEIDKLSDKERQVIALYYYEELTMKEIAQVMDLTESRVSQINTMAVKKLKRRLKDLYG